MIKEMRSKIKVKNREKPKSYFCKRILLTLMLVTMLFAVACGGSAGLTPEQLKELEETKAAALSAEEKIQQRKVTKKSLSNDLSGKKKELKQILADKEVLINRLKDLENLTNDETEADTSAVDTSSVDNGEGR